MAQHDYDLANQNGLSFRSDLNAALSAIVSQNSGTTAPPTTFANMWWADTSANMLKRRNADNTAWLNILPLDLAISSFMHGMLNDPDAATARATLGATSVGGSVFTATDAAAARAAIGAASTLTATETATGIAEIATQQETDAGTDDARIVTPKKLQSTLLVKNAFQSAELSITSAGTLTVEHGLGVVPKLVQLVLVCKTAEGGYSVGDEVLYTAGYAMSATSDAAFGMSLRMDATNFGITYGSQSSVFLLVHKANGTRWVTTNANWRLVIRAYA